MLFTILYKGYKSKSKVKFLLDENVPVFLKKVLKKAGFSAEHVNDISKGKKDPDVFAYALQHKQCIISKDKDYYNMRLKKHFGIIRIGKNYSDEELEKTFLKLLKYIEENGIEDIYYQLDKDQPFKELKKYGKKKPFRFKQTVKINIDLLKFCL